MQFYAPQPAKKTGKQRKEPLLSFRISQLYFVSRIVLVTNNGVKTCRTLDVHFGGRTYREMWNQIALRGTTPYSPRLAAPQSLKRRRIRSTRTDTLRTQLPRSRWCELCSGCRQRPVRAGGGMDPSPLMRLDRRDPQVRTMTTQCLSSRAQSCPNSPLTISGMPVSWSPGRQKSQSSSLH